MLGEYNKSASSPFLKLERGDAERGLHEAYVQAYDDRIPGRHQGHAQPVCLQQDLLRPLVPARELHDRRGRGRQARGARLAGPRAITATGRGARPSVEIPAEPAQAEARSVRLSWPVPTLPILYLGYHVPASDPSNPDTAALGALEQAVFGETSPLYRALVLDEQKVVTLMADAEPRRDPGLFTICARVRKPEDLPAVRKRIAEALSRGRPDRRSSRHAWTRSGRISVCLRRHRSTAPTRWPGRVGESIAIDRPARRDERPLSPPMSGSPPPTSSASPPAISPPPTRRWSPSRRRRSQMTTRHRLAMALALLLLASCPVAVCAEPVDNGELEAARTRRYLPIPLEPPRRRPVRVPGRLAGRSRRARKASPR